MIETFTRAEFESVLPVGWEYNGFESGEHTYVLRIPEKRVAVLVRSSIKYDGVAANTGEDSIRIVLINTETHRPLAEKVDAWTQRTSGWQERMQDKIHTLYEKGSLMYNCPQCSKGVLVEKEGKFGTFFGCSNYPSCKYTTKVRPAAQPKPIMPDDDVVDMIEAVSAVEDFGFDFEDATDAYTSERPVKEIRLNAQQRAYVEAPVDANIRVMASPGSGKTASTIERIVYLIEHGIKPENIVYVTFTKSMADEGFKRIVKRLPSVEDSHLAKQICTIHALCYRLLMWEGVKRNVPKDWEVKVALNALIAGDYKQGIIGEWQYAFEMPGYKEVLYWIDNAKAQGITPDQDLAYFSRHMVSDHAMKVHNCRIRFDEWLTSRNYLTFIDMLYLVEQRLINDSAFRNKYQKKFTHVLVDEAQDVNAQALRILITLSLEPGDNRVYKSWKGN